MNIFAEIEGIEYKIKIPNKLKIIDFKDFNINNIPSSCNIKVGFTKKNTLISL